MVILRNKEYEIWELRDNKDILRGYVLKKGNARYKASELGKGRNLMATKMEDTWKKLHTVPKAKVVSMRRVAGKPLPIVGMMSAQAVPLGGGTSGDLPWELDKDEDEREWARRCAREAARVIGKKPKIGRKR